MRTVTLLNAYRRSAIAILILGALSACDDAVPRATGPAAAAGRVSGSTPEATQGAGAPVTPAAIERVKAARARVHWVAQLHTDAMNEVRAMGPSWRGGRSHGLADRCVVALTVGRRYGSRAADRLGLSARDVASALRASAREHGCAVPADVAALSGRAPSPALLAIYSVMQTADETLTGEFQNYTPGLDAAYANASTPSDVDYASWAVVYQAAANGLGQADLDVLAAIADIGVSSAYEWYAYELSGGFSGGGGGGDPTQEAMSIFRLGFGPIKWRAVGWSDLGGAIAGALGGAAGGPAGAFGGAVTRGAVASAVSALAQI